MSVEYSSTLLFPKVKVLYILCVTKETHTQPVEAERANILDLRHE